MSWTEVPSKRTRTGSHYNLDGTSQFVFDQVLKTYRHYPTAGPDSDVLDGVVDMTPRRVDVPTFDGWLVTDADWYYALGMPKTGALANLDGVVGFGGRQGQHWFKYRLQSAGYLRGSTRDWVSLGTATYNRANLSQSTEALPVGPNGDTVNVMSTATWADLWPALPNGKIDVRWRAEGRRLKEEIVISQAARQWIAANRGPAWAFPGVALSDVWFGFVFRLDWADIPKVTIAGVQQSFDSDFNDDNGQIELRTALDELLTLMPVDDVFVLGAENAENGRTALRKRLWRAGDNHYLLVGVRYDVLAGLAAGDLVFDPTLDLQPDGTAGVDTTLNSGNTDKSYGSELNITGIPSLIEFDCSSIDAAATCDSASMYLVVTGTSGIDRLVTANELLSGNDGWLDGATEDPATGNQSTWDYKNQTGSGAGTAWAGSAGASTSGTDYNATQIGSVTYPASSPVGTELAMSLTAIDVEDWFGASNANYGMRLVFAIIWLASSDHATAAYRPRLVVVYTEAGGAGNPWWYYAQQ